LHGLPASVLSDNGAVFTGSYRGGKVLLQYELERLRIEFKNARPHHPQTCGKVERLFGRTQSPVGHVWAPATPKQGKSGSSAMVGLPLQGVVGVRGEL